MALTCHVEYTPGSDCIVYHRYFAPNLYLELLAELDLGKSRDTMTEFSSITHRSVDMWPCD